MRHVVNGSENIFKHFDYAWAAVPESEDDFGMVPENMGILRYVNGQLEIIRQTIRNPEADLQLVSRRIVPYILKTQMKN